MKKYTVVLANNESIEVIADGMMLNGTVITFYRENALGVNGNGQKEASMVAAFQQWVIVKEGALEQRTNFLPA